MSGIVIDYIQRTHCKSLLCINFDFVLQTTRVDSFSLFDADLSAKLVTDIVEVLNIMQIQPRYGSCEIP